MVCHAMPTGLLCPTPNNPLCSTITILCIIEVECVKRAEPITLPRRAGQRSGVSYYVYCGIRVVEPADLVIEVAQRKAMSVLCSLLVLIGTTVNIWRTGNLFLSSTCNHRGVSTEPIACARRGTAVQRYFACSCSTLNVFYPITLYRLPKPKSYSQL